MNIGKIHRDSRGLFIQYRENISVSFSEIKVDHESQHLKYLSGDLVHFTIIESWVDLSLVPFAKIIN